MCFESDVFWVLMVWMMAAQCGHRCDWEDASWKWVLLWIPDRKALKLRAKYKIKQHGAMKDNASLSLPLPSGADFLSGVCIVSGVCVVRPAKVEPSITAASQDPGGGGISMATGACTSTPTPTHHTPTSPQGAADWRRGGSTAERDNTCQRKQHYKCTVSVCHYVKVKCHLFLFLNSDFSH